MKLLILTQYFTVTMVCTISIGLFVLKPTVNNGMVATKKIEASINTEQNTLINKQNILVKHQ
jgi:hypothetical protein